MGKVVDGVELLRMIRDDEIKINTEMKIIELGITLVYLGGKVIIYKGDGSRVVNVTDFIKTNIEILSEEDEEIEVSDQLIERQNLEIDNLKSELEIKDKMIDLLIDKLFNLDYEHNFQKVICDYIPKAKCDTYEDDKCDICVKEYIRNEVLKDE